MSGIRQVNSNQKIQISDASGNTATITGGKLDVNVSITPEQKSVVDDGNSTITPLGINGVFTGVWKELTSYINVSVAISTDKTSITDGLVVQWSQDGITVDDTDVFTIQAGATKQFTFGAAHKYLRIKYTNDGVAQTVFRLQTILHTSAPKPSSHRLQDSISDQDDVELNKSIIAGRNPSGTYVNFQATTAGNFKTSLEELETNISVNSKKQLKVTPFDSSGTEIKQGVTIEDLYKVLQEIRDGYDMDVTIDKPTLSRRALLQTGSTTAVTGTLTAVTTVTNVAQIGAADASAFIKDSSFQSWALSTRNLLN